MKGWMAAALVLALSQPGLAFAKSSEGEWVTHLYMNDIRDLAVTGQGVWCATGGGALFYDFELGRFRAWNRSANGLASDTLTSIAALDDGRVAFGTRAAGLSLYHPERNLWQNYTSLTYPIAGNEILSIVEQSPWRIIGSRGGFVAMNAGEVREACQEGLDICGLPGWSISAGIEYEGALWLGALSEPGSGGVGRLDYGSTGEWTLLNTGALASRPEVIGFARWDDSLFCAYRGGVAVWTGQTWAPRRAGLPAYIEMRDIIAGPRDLLVALSAAEGGVFRWDGAGQRWERLGTMQAQSVAQEPDGIVWAGTGSTRSGVGWLPEDQDGLWEYVAGEWIQHRYDSPHPLESYRDLALDADGRLYAALAARLRGWGLARLDENGWQLFNQDNTELSNSWVLDLRAQGDAVWAGHCCCAVPTDACYLNLWDPATGAVAVHDSVMNVHASIEDPYGNVWFASWFETTPAAAYGLYHLDAASGRIDHYTSATTGGLLKSDKITDVAWEGDALWIGYHSDGVSRCRLDGHGLPILEESAWEHFTTESAGQPLLNNAVRALAAREGEVWIGTVEGVSLYRNGAWRIFRPGPFGLPGSAVTDIALTADGAAWIGITGSGVTRITKDATGAFMLDSFGPPDLVNPSVTTLAVGAEGRDLWVGTEDGLSHFIPTVAPQESSADRIAVYPNPYNPNCGAPLRLAEIPGRAARGTITDVAGRIIARFGDKWTQEAIWDGRDEHGSAVPPGCYVIRASTPHGWLTGQVAVLDLPCEEP